MPLPSGITDERAVQTGGRVGDEPGRLDGQNTPRTLTAFEKVLADTARSRELNAKREAALSLKQKSMVSGDPIGTVILVVYRAGVWVLDDQFRYACTTL